MKGELISPTKIEMVLYSRNTKDKEPFVSSECAFTPCGWAKIENQPYPLGYKIVTEDLKSLGLRKNPNIMSFPVGGWVILPETDVAVDSDDRGGIWTALNKGSIKTLRSYMLDMYNIKTRAFLTAMCRPVYANSYRIKSQGVMLLEEVF